MKEDERRFNVYMTAHEFDNFTTNFHLVKQEFNLSILFRFLFYATHRKDHKIRQRTLQAFVQAKAIHRLYSNFRYLQVSVIDKRIREMQQFDSCESQGFITVRLCKLDGALTEGQHVFRVMQRFSHRPKINVSVARAKHCRCWDAVINCRLRKIDVVSEMYRSHVSSRAEVCYDSTANATRVTGEAATHRFDRIVPCHTSASAGWIRDVERLGRGRFLDTICILFKHADIVCGIGTTHAAI
jgi:hypothetical protein